MFSVLTSKLFGGLSIGLAIALGFLWLANGRLTKQVETLTTWQTNLVAEIRTASGNPKVTPGNAKEQVYQLGRSVTVMIGATKTQNDAIETLSRQRDEARVVAERERANRAVAIAKAVDLAKQLRTETKPVSQADVEKEVRRVQDLAYEAGL